MDTLGQPRLALDTDEQHQDLPEPSALPLNDADEGYASRAAPDPEPGMLEAGRALVPAEFAPPSISAAERLVRFAYRMGVPGPTLAAPFRKRARLRLLATAESPLAGDRVAGVAAAVDLGEGPGRQHAGNPLARNLHRLTDSRSPVGVVGIVRPRARLLPRFQRRRCRVIVAFLHRGFLLSVSA